MIHGFMFYMIISFILMRNLKFVTQGSRLTFHLSSQVASERFDFTSQNKFSLARLFCIISYCVQYV